MFSESTKRFSHLKFSTDSLQDHKVILPTFLYRKTNVLTRVYYHSMNKYEKNKIQFIRVHRLNKKHRLYRVERVYCIGRENAKC